MITVQQLSMRYGAKILFENVQMQFVAGERLGLIGANGAGKSTFLKIMSREEKPTSGEILLPNGFKLGILEQDFKSYTGITLVDVVMSGKKELHAISLELDRLSGSEEFTEEIAAKYADLEERFSSLGGYAAQSEAARLLDGLGIPQEKQDQVMENFSGGYKLRVLLARLLYSEPDILLLDEPTNHLDLYSIRWLEGYLMRYKGIIVVTSHDREFINSVANTILEVDYGSIRKYKGNYTQYLRQVEEQRTHSESILAKSEKKRGEMQDFVNRFKAKATKAKQAQSRMRMIEKMDIEMEEHHAKASTRRSPAINFTSARPSGSTPFLLESICKSYGDAKVLNDVSFEVDRGDRLAVIGPNGIGKSTLLKIITESLNADTGKCKIGSHVEISYLPQDMETAVQGDCTVLEWFQAHSEPKSLTEQRKVLGALLFSGDDADKKVDNLSGGERARLILAEMMDKHPNVLVLDEPTNHLDLETIESLIDALKKFEGTVVFVSHNRYFVSSLATRVIEIGPESIRDIRGGYDAYLDMDKTDHLERDVSLKQRHKGSTVAEPKQVLTEEEISQLKIKERQVKKEFMAHEKNISNLEKELEVIHAKVGDPALYEKGREDEAKALSKKGKDAEEKLSEEMGAWEKKGEIIESLKVQIQNKT